VNHTKKIVIYHQSDYQVITIIPNIYSIETSMREDGQSETLINGSLFDCNTPYIVIDETELPELKEGQSLDASFVLQKKKEDKIQELNNQCSQAILSGFVSATTGYQYGFSYEDQLNWTQQMLLIISDDTIQTVDWKTDAVGIVPHARDQFLAVCNEGGAHKRGCIEKFWSLRNQVVTATTIAELNHIYW
jgi:hypothetical protein